MKSEKAWKEDKGDIVRLRLAGQNTIMHQIANYLKYHVCSFTPHYRHGIVKAIADRGVLTFTVLGGRFGEQTEGHLREHGLNKVDYRGETNEYCLVVTCQGLIIQKNRRRKKKIVLAQKGMTVPETLIYHVEKLKFPRSLASTSKLT